MKAGSPSTEPSSSRTDPLRSLGVAALGLEDLFACGDSSVIGLDGITVTIRSSASSQQLPLQLPAALYSKQGDAVVPSPQWSAFQQELDVSPFGDGQKTKVDPNVRAAQHVPAARIVAIDGLELEPIVASASAMLFPGKPVCDAELHKLNVYQAGGHFVTHQDTPLKRKASRRHVGSLVVCLPAAHEGGKLVCQHRGAEVAFAFDADVRLDERGASGKAIGARASLMSGQRRLSWAAFYSNVPHKVEAVTGGTRITLTYHLWATESRATKSSRRLNDADTAQHCSTMVAALRSRLSGTKVPALKAECAALGLQSTGTKATLVDRIVTHTEGLLGPAMNPRVANECSRALFDAWTSALANPDFLTDGGTVAFPTFHTYAFESELPLGKVPKHASGATLSLKGADFSVAMIPARLGLPVQCKRQMIFDDGGDPIVTSSDTLATSAGVHEMAEPVTMYRSQEWALDLSQYPDCDDENSIDEYDWAITPKWGGKPAPVQAKGTLRPADWPLLQDMLMSPNGYFGNESGNGAVYAAVAILVEVPEWSSSRAEMAAAAARPGVQDFVGVRAGKRPQQEGKEAQDRMLAFYQKRREDEGEDEDDDEEEES